MKYKEKKTKRRFLLIFVIAVVLIVVGFLWIKMEGEAPKVKLADGPLYFGLQKELEITALDRKSGIRSIWVGLFKDGKEHVLLEESLAGGGLFFGSGVQESAFPITVAPKKLGVSDGKAKLRIVVRDHSWRRFFKGNKSYVEKEVTIDTRPPEVTILSKFHYLNQGGTGLVVYQLSEPVFKTGVYVGDVFFPGYAGYFDDNRKILAFFALNFKQGPGTNIAVYASDKAQNSVRSGFRHNIKRRVFRKDSINISDKFLNWKMPEFAGDINHTGDLTSLETFIKVNRELREQNTRTIFDVCKTTAMEWYWDGPFLRLPNAQRRAGFADHRAYKYKGRLIDRQVHLGIDLASIAQSEVPAANRGKVVFADRLGIYGKSVIIDHGFGVFSMYSHLSQISIANETIVKKGQRIGFTGVTGLAGGDHLHFSMIIHNTFVQPIEWWDPLWIDKRVMAKLARAETKLSD